MQASSDVYIQNGFSAPIVYLLILPTTQEPSKPDMFSVGSKSAIVTAVFVVTVMVVVTAAFI